MLVVVLVALAAAFLYAISDFLEQRAAQRARRRAGREPSGRPGDRLSAARGVAGRMVRDREWVAGWAVGTVAYLVQGFGLYLGSVAVVQALQVTTLLFTLPLATVGRPERPSSRDLLAAASVCIGLGAFLWARGPLNTGTPQRGRILLLLAVIATVVVLLTITAIRLRGAPRATLLALGAGCAFACNASLVKMTGQELATGGVVRTALDWPGYSIAVVSVVGVTLQQAAFASGRLPAATTASVIANPLVGTVIAVIGFAEPLPADGGRFAVMLLAPLPFVAGLIVLPRSPLLRGDGDDPDGDQTADASGSRSRSSSRRSELGRVHSSRTQRAP